MWWVFSGSISGCFLPTCITLAPEAAKGILLYMFRQLVCSGEENIRTTARREWVSKCVWSVIDDQSSSSVNQNMISNLTNVTKPVLDFTVCVQMSFQMWVQWRDWPTTGPGTPCTGPAPPRPPSADTPWTRAERTPSRGTPWSLSQRKTTHMCWPWTSVKSQSRFRVCNIWYWIQNMVPWLNARFIGEFIEILLLYWHWAKTSVTLLKRCSVSAGRMTLQFRPLIPGYRQTFGLISLPIYLFIALYVDMLPRRATESSQSPRFLFFFLLLTVT